MKKYVFSSTGLKLIAIIAMFIDHVGAVFFEDIILFRIVGRLTLPIMAYFIALGFTKTKDLKRYIGRLLFWGVVTIVPYAYYFESGYQNVLFTFAVSLFALWGTEKIKNRDLQIVLITVCSVLVTLFKFDGFFIAILTVWIFHTYPNQPQRIIRSYIGLMVAYQFAILLSYDFNLKLLMDWDYWYHFFSIAGVVLVLQYNGEKGPKLVSRLFFYLFYPLHLAFLSLIKYFLYNQ